MKFTTFILIATVALSGCETTSPLVPPRIIEQGEVLYPEALQEQRLEGKALVEFDVNEDGSVSNAKVVSATHELFGEAALHAVENSKFSPPMQNGKPVSNHMRLPIYFKPPPSEKED